MPGREDEVADSGENDPAKSANRWLLNAIKPAAPQVESLLPAARVAPEKPATLTDLGPTARNGPVTFTRLFHLALPRGRISLGGSREIRLSPIQADFLYRHFT